MRRVNISDLADALLFVSSDYDAEAYVSRETGELFLTGDPGIYDFGEEPLPDDVDDPSKYVPVPDKRDLDLGTQLVYDFTKRHLLESYDDVRTMFRNRGAYGRFKDLLEREGELEHWYKFSDAAEERALIRWCEENGLPYESDGDT